MNSKQSIYTGFEFEDGGFPAFAVINKNLKELQNRFSFQYAVFIGVVPIEYNEHGHPEGEEEVYILKVEEDIMSAIEVEGETLHVGHITLSLKTEMVFYTQVPDKVEEYLNAYLPTISRESSFEILEDPEWENVEGFYEMID